MKYCTRCGARLPDEATNCTNCGAQLSAGSSAGGIYIVSPYYGAIPVYGPAAAAPAPTPAPAPAPAPADSAPKARRAWSNGTPEHGAPAMLKLTGIKKDYKIASGSVHALKGVSLEFRKNEFVCILGQSGCGKTTLLNIIGGLDHYTEGDLVIQGKSTKKYRDRDWDVYRNHRIGFIFQTYNLIPHQTVLQNVELALTIAGVGKAERQERAKKALERVGLGGEFNKRPNQLSGGQMQRVAIARALVNDPDILLADEPTGALDSKTSVEVMELIKEIAAERLVIMVTHNADLAEEYASRIVCLKDGLVESDSNPYIGDRGSAKVTETKSAKQPRAKMGYFTSLALSFRNLLTKKGRTVITSIAGSIGIISVCLVLALSSGFNTYIRHTEEDMLSYYPLEVSETALDITAVMSAMTSPTDIPTEEELKDKVYVNSFLTSLAQGITVQNNITDEYISYLEAGKEEHPEWFSAIQYNYGFEMADALFTPMVTGGVLSHPETAVRNYSITQLKSFLIEELIAYAPQYSNLLRFVSLFEDVINKMPGTADFTSDDYSDYVLSQYDVIAGHFPQNEHEAVLVVGEGNAVLDLTLVQLGFLTEERFLQLFDAGLSAAGGAVPTAVTLAEEADPQDPNMIGFDAIFDQPYVLYYGDELYRKADRTEGAGNALTDPVYEYVGERTGDLTATEEQGIDFKISAILRLKENFTYGCLTEGLNLTEATVDRYVRQNKNSDFIKWITSDEARIPDELSELFGLSSMAAYRSPASHLNENYTAIDLSAARAYAAENSGREFVEQAETLLDQKFGDVMSKEELQAFFGRYRTLLAGMVGPQFAEDFERACMELGDIVTREQFEAVAGDLLVRDTVEPALGFSLKGTIYVTYLPSTVLRLLGGDDEPNDIFLYPSDFDAKEHVLAYLDGWNDAHDEGDQIQYTDRVGLLMGMVQTMLNVITYVLVAFTAISLVVSSVMIGIITYVSVVERVKEIGVLRSLGARKKDIRNLFNAETFIIGLAAGLIGIAVTYILAAIVSAIIYSLSGIAGIATLPPLTAVIMVIVSVVLTLISGLIPAQAAARKDPVIALRTE